MRLFSKFSRCTRTAECKGKGNGHHSTSPTVLMPTFMSCETLSHTVSALLEEVESKELSLN